MCSVSLFEMRGGRFVDIDGIVDHHCLNFLCFVDIGGIDNHHYLNFLCFVDIGGIDNHHC
jgi:hypothetical protein